MNYAIFRSQPIYTLNDLAQIGSHNKREKKAYTSNPDIKLEFTKNNIELKKLDSKYVKGFHEITKEYEKEHNERMKTERDDRKRTFNQMLDRSKNVVADELIFTASPNFFNNITNEDLKAWANTCMEFVYNDLGYTKEQVLHATVHMDEKTPHIHCVVIPLVKKFDKRTNTERYTISKKQYIHDNKHLSELQDKFYERMIEKGFDLNRGIKNSDKEHLDIKTLKKVTRNLNKDLNKKHEKLNESIKEFENNIKDNKSVLFDKDYVKVKKETFNSMNKVIVETNKLMKVQEKVENVFEDVSHQSRSYDSIDRQNKSLQNEVNNLREENEELKSENNSLKYIISNLFEKLKKFFRKILLKGDYESQDYATEQIKEIYDDGNYKSKDVYDISRGTDKQDDLFEYAHIPNYYKEKIKRGYEEREVDDDFEL